MHWLRRLFRKQQAERELDAELRDHLDRQISDYIASGVSPKEARRGNLLETLLQDLRCALRMLRKKPGFASIAILTLALGIGANTAIFSFLDAVFLNGLPYSNPSRLIELSEKNPQGENDSVYPGDLVEWRTTARSFEDISFIGEMNPYTITGVGEPDEVWGWPVSQNLFQVLGVHAALGRTFLSGDTRSIVLSDHYWRAHFSANPRIIGRTVFLDGAPFTVVGVMPSSFYLRTPATNLWFPLSLASQEADSHSKHTLAVIARLKPKVTLQQARAEMDGIQSRLADLYPKDDKGWMLSLNHLHDSDLDEFQNIVLALLGAVFFTLLIACANVANMFLARGTTRQRELAVRAALGASSHRLLRLVLAETVLVSIFGGLLGIALAMAAMRFLVHLVPIFSLDGISGLQNLSLNFPVLSFASALSLLTGLAIGTIPALRGSRLDLIENLKDGAPSASPSRRKLRVQGFFVTTEVALTLILLVGAGLMVESFRRLANVHPGYNPNHVLTVRVPLVANKYSQGPQAVAFYQEVLQRIQATPGVDSAAMVNNLPFSGVETMGCFDESANLSGESKENICVRLDAVSPRYFHSMGIPLLRGRDFTVEDYLEHAQKVAIVDESMVRRYWGRKDIIGKSVLQNITIVGIAASTRRESLGREPVPQMYVPYGQHPFASFMITFVIRTASDPLSLVPAMRTAVWSIDRDQPIIQIRTMQTVVEESIWRQRFSLTLLVILATVALLLSVVGLYGVISYSVSQRTREIGIRVALGADRPEVLKLVIGQGFVWILFGAVVGLAGSFALTRFLASLLYDVKATDPAIFAGAAALLTVVAEAACYVPARRAMRVDPVIALRYE